MNTPHFLGPTVLFKSVDSLLPYARNARTHSASQVSQLAASILEWGWTNPILADDRGIVAGHGRLAAARLLYAEGKVLRLPNGEPVPVGQVPVLDVSGWPESKRRAYVLADNKIALSASWDSTMLAEELRALQEDDFDLGLAGFSDEEAEKVLSGMKVDEPTFLDSFSLDSDESSSSKEPTKPEPNIYQAKIISPVYQITGEKPVLAELYDHTRTKELLDEIRAANLPPDMAQFLESAAERHTEFDFSKIAEFYAHSEAPIQRLFERSVLVIIDADQAIERGFLRLNQRLDAVLDSTGAEDEDEDEGVDDAE
jgi:hypothetical protein